MDRRLMSFAAALGVIALLVAGIAWAVETEALPDSGSILKLTYGPVPGTHKFKAPVEGKTGPLGQCVVCHSVEKNGAFRVAPGLWG
ncbi:MAG: hypothetical protein MI861_04300, partial [Pirellulales bacterium]|nr:hypothetical protein [Pirellulales bacterium]